MKKQKLTRGQISEKVRAGEITFNVESVTKSAKRLNQRMVRMEKTRGTAYDLTKTRQYRVLQERAKELGAKKRSATSGYRFKEKGIKNLSQEDLNKLGKKLLQYETFATSKSGIEKSKKTTMERLKKKGISVSESEVEDFYQSHASGAYKRLEEQYGSTQSVNILQSFGWDTSKVGDMLDYYDAYKAGKTFDKEEFLEYLYTGKLPE